MGVARRPSAVGATGVRRTCILPNWLALQANWDSPRSSWPTWRAVRCWVAKVAGRSRSPMIPLRWPAVPVCPCDRAQAFALAEHDPLGARALLTESLAIGGAPGEEISSGLLTATMVAARLRDWALTLTLATRTMHLWRWSAALMQTAPCLSLCARAIAEARPEVAGVLRGAAYAAYRAASPSGPSGTTPDADAPHFTFVLEALCETGGIVIAALGRERERAVRAEGAAMTMDPAVTYALDNAESSSRWAPRDPEATAATIGTTGVFTTARRRGRFGDQTARPCRRGTRLIGEH